MNLRVLIPSTRIFHDLQDKEVEKEVKSNPRIGSFKRILRKPDGTGGEELTVDKTRQTIYFLITGYLYPIKDRIGQRVTDWAFILRARNFTDRILKAYPDHNIKTDFTLVRNASSTDLITVVRDGGLNTSVVVDGHGTKTWVNMTDGKGKRVSNNTLLRNLGDEQLRVLIQSTCTDYIYDDNGVRVVDDKINGDTKFGDGLAEIIIRPDGF